MANLVTLEGAYNYNSMNQILDRLFDCNDVLGVMIYGPQIWNKIKNYVANLASKQIVLNRGRKYYGAVYTPTNDVLDRAFGFNDSLGVQLLGNSWDGFKKNCKAAAPTLGFNFVKNIILDPVQKSIKAILPASANPIDILKFVTGIQQVDTAIDTAKSITGQNEAEQKRAEAQAEKELAEQIRLQQLELAEAEKDRELELQKEAIRAEAEASADYKAKVATSPEALQAQTNNLLLLAGFGLAALLVMRNK